MSIGFTPNTRLVLPKLQSIIEFLSLYLSDLHNKISLCNISDRSGAKNIKKGRLPKEMLRRVNKMQPSQSNWNFPDFPPVPLSKPELLKLTIIMKIEMYYPTRRQRCQLIFPPVYRGSIVTFLAWRYNLRETAWLQTTELKNP